MSEAKGPRVVNDFGTHDTPLAAAITPRSVVQYGFDPNTN
jgi:hypothetical protein